MLENVEKLKKDNPDFEYHLYDDTECRAFIQANFEPDVAEAYDQLIPGAFKADLWRYCVLYINGGFYLDIKFRCEPGFSLSDINESTFFVREYNHKGTGLYGHIIYTGCICSYPRNPLFMKCIRQIVTNCKDKYYGPEHTAPTGPYLFASMMDPEEIENSEYAYYEEKGIGYIRNIETTKVILSHYPEYRTEQKGFGKSTYWKDAWFNKQMYRD
jgi:mannosyltransferase OCH1-like enzyme